MDKSNEKGRTRNRYAKLQPLVNRINELQGLNPTSNSFDYHPALQYNERCIDSSYAHQLQNDFGNLVLATSKATKVVKQPVIAEDRNSKMPEAFFDQSVFSPARNAEKAGKQKQHKQRIKAKLCRTSPIDLKAELLDILNCVLYILWSPIVFFPRLFLTLTSSTASVLYNMLKWFLPGSRTTSPEKQYALKPAEKEPEICNSFPADIREEKQAPDLNKFLATRCGCDINPGSCFVTPEVKNNNTVGLGRTQDKKSQKDLESLRKKFNLSLKKVDEPHGNPQLQGGNNHLYSSCHQDISSVELSSDYLSDKYSSRFLDYKDCKKKAPKQYQDSISIAGKKMSFSMLRNTSFKGSRTVVNSKRSQIDSKNSFCKSEFRFLMKNVATQLSETSKSSETRLQRICPKNRSHATYKHTDLKPRSVDYDSSVTGGKDQADEHKESSSTSFNNFRKKRLEKSRPHAFPPLPLRPTLQKRSSSEDEEKCEAKIKKCDYTLSDDLKSNLAAFDLENSNLQPNVDLNYELTKQLEPHIDMRQDLSQKKTLNDTAVVPISLNQYAVSSISQCNPDSDTLKNSATVSGGLEGVSESSEATRRDECKKQTETSESLSLRGVEVDLLQSEKICQDLEEEKRTNVSGDHVKASKNSTLRMAEFTKPIDAKSKWIEMKKKFYGKDYTATKELPEKLEAQNLSRISSVSQLPAHKIFQYNMQVGRARQMGTEPPSAEEIFLEKKATSPCLKALHNSVTGPNPRGNDQQLFKSTIPTSRCLSHTQSLSQWPLDLGNSCRTKKYCSKEQKPKPKPRTEGRFNPERIGGHGETTTLGSGAAQNPQRALNGANSCVSSSNFRHDQGLQSRPRSLDRPSQDQMPTDILSMKNTTLSDEYAEKIDSLISFCRYPASVPRESIDTNFKAANYTSHTFFDEAAAGDSS